MRTTSANMARMPLDGLPPSRATATRLSRGGNQRLSSVRFTSCSSTMTTEGRTSPSVRVGRVGGDCVGVAAAAGPGSPCGRRTTNVLPRPGVLVHSTLPPWISASRRTRARPRPVPTGRRARLQSSWMKGSKIRSSASGAMPVSETQNLITAPQRSPATSSTTDPPEGVNFTALSSRMTRIWGGGGGWPATGRDRVPRRRTAQARPAAARDDW